MMNGNLTGNESVVSIVCRNCNKKIGKYTGEGLVYAMCDSCFEGWD